MIQDAYLEAASRRLLQVWHLGRRELLGSLPSRGRCLFHPDGRRLLFCAPEGGIGVWDRDGRRVVRRLPPDFGPDYLALDPEGRRLAVNNAYPAAPRVAILELETGRVLADWRSQVGNGAMAWSDDGQLLAVGGGGYDPRVYVWKVRRGALSSMLQGHTAEVVGAQFAHSGYLLATSSWDETLIDQYPKDPNLLELRSQAHDRLGHREQAEADRKQAAETPRAGAEQYNNLAWRLATGPVATRDAERALALARKAVELTPGAAIYLNTLGVALYRKGQYAEAIATLEKSLAASKGQSDAFDLYFLAMARHSLGQITRARVDLDRAVRWQRDHSNLTQSGWSEELNLFRAEAEQVLAGPSALLPADVFAPK